jgi:integrase
MATIRERRPGVWEVRAFTGRDERGRPTQVSRTVRGTKKDAQRVAGEMTVRPPGRGAGLTVADALRQWADLNDATWAPTTQRDHRGRMEMILQDRIAVSSVARLTVADVERWHARLRKAGVGEAAIRNRNVVLRAALAQAVRWGWVTTNVAAAARLRSPKAPPRSGMNAAEVRQVLEAAAAIGPEVALALRLAAVAGARRSEIAALRWGGVVGDQITIDSAICTIRHGAPGSPSVPTLIDAATKTANRRTVTLDPDTAAMIEAQRAERGLGGPWMFALGERPANPDQIGAWWSRARKAAGIDPKWRLHDLRHWSATVAIGHGHDVRTVANRLGHSDASMTLRVYAHAIRAADEAVARTLGHMLESAETRRGTTFPPPFDSTGTL